MQPTEKPSSAPSVLREKFYCSWKTQTPTCCWEPSNVYLLNFVLPYLKPQCPWQHWVSAFPKGCIWDPSVTLLCHKGQNPWKPTPASNRQSGLALLSAGSLLLAFSLLGQSPTTAFLQHVEGDWWDQTHLCQQWNIIRFKTHESESSRSVRAWLSAGHLPYLLFLFAVGAGQCNSGQVETSCALTLGQARSSHLLLSHAQCWGRVLLIVWVWPNSPPSFS